MRLEKFDKMKKTSVKTICDEKNLDELVNDN